MYILYKAFLGRFFIRKGYIMLKIRSFLMLNIIVWSQWFFCAVNYAGNPSPKKRIRYVLSLDQSLPTFLQNDDLLRCNFQKKLFSLIRLQCALNAYDIDAGLAKIRESRPIDLYFEAKNLALAIFNNFIEYFGIEKEGNCWELGKKVKNAFVSVVPNGDGCKNAESFLGSMWDLPFYVICPKTFITNIDYDYDISLTHSEIRCCGIDIVDTALKIIHGLGHYYFSEIMNNFPDEFRATFFEMSALFILFEMVQKEDFSKYGDGVIRYCKNLTCMKKLNSLLKWCSGQKIDDISNVETSYIIYELASIILLEPIFWKINKPNKKKYKLEAGFCVKKWKAADWTNALEKCVKLTNDFSKISILLKENDSLKFFYCQLHTIFFPLILKQNSSRVK